MNSDTTKKIMVIHHSADFDGIFCREIARKFLPDAELIGWDFKDAPLAIPNADVIYVMDLPVDSVFGLEKFGRPSGGSSHAAEVRAGLLSKVIWIDHHASSIETHTHGWKGYRIDGVAACRLVWQWFVREKTLSGSNGGLIGIATKYSYVDRMVDEPLAVRLAGEYDIWDKRDPDAELLQHGLRSQELSRQTWDMLLDSSTDQVLKGTGMDITNSELICRQLINQGRCLQFARAQEYADVITQQGFDVKFHGVHFLACNSHELDIRSHLFEAGIKPHHEALMGFAFNGHDWRVSLYRIAGKDQDILSIAKSYGGGGHVGACGFRTKTLPIVS